MPPFQWFWSVGLLDQRSRSMLGRSSSSIVDFISSIDRHHRWRSICWTIHQSNPYRHFSEWRLSNRARWWESCNRSQWWVESCCSWWGTKGGCLNCCRRGKNRAKGHIWWRINQCPQGGWSNPLCIRISIGWTRSDRHLRNPQICFVRKMEQYRRNQGTGDQGYHHRSLDTRYCSAMCHWIPLCFSQVKVLQTVHQRSGRKSLVEQLGVSCWSRNHPHIRSHSTWLTLV